MCILLGSFCRAYALPAPFVWPESYAITLTETSKSKHTKPFVNMMAVDGMKTRNDITLPPENARVEIFRMEERRRIVIKPNGEIQQSQLPDDWPMRSTIFPPSNNWELLGNDEVSGQSALKYKVNRDDEQMHASAIAPAPYAVVWFSADNKMPLLMVDGDRVVEFSNYVPGPQNSGLFEPVRKPIGNHGLKAAPVAASVPAPTPVPTADPAPTSSSKLVILPAPKIKAQ